MLTASERYLLYQPFRLLSTYFFSFSKTFFGRPGAGSSLPPFRYAVLIAERLAHQDDLAFLEPLRRTHMHHQRTADARRDLAVVTFAVRRAGRSRAKTLRVLRRGDVSRPLDRTREIRTQLVDAAHEHALFRAVQCPCHAVAGTVDQEAYERTILAVVASIYS